MSGDALTLGLFAFRAILNVSALLLIGLALQGAVGIIRSDALMRWRGWIVVLATLTGALAFARLLLLNVQMGDGSTLFDADLTALAWMALGSSSLAFAIGALTIVLGFLLRQRLVLAAGAIVLAAGFALTGHTQALVEPGLAPAAIALHTAIAGFWVVAPLTLAPARLADDVLLARLRRFTAVAVVAVPVLFGLGIWLAWMLAGGIDGLLGTPYGQLLVIKLLAAMAALGMGAINQRIVTARVAADPAKGRLWLRRTLAVETILFAVAVLAVSAATTLSGPGETVAGFFGA